MQYYSVDNGIKIEGDDFSLLVTRSAYSDDDECKVSSYDIQYDGSNDEHELYASDSWVAEHAIVYILNEYEYTNFLPDDSVVLCRKGSDAGSWFDESLVDPSLIEYRGPGLSMGTSYISPSALQNFTIFEDENQQGSKEYILFSLGD